MHKIISYLLIAGLATWVGGSITSTPSFPRIVAKVALTNQTSTIPATTILTPTQNALYRISVYMVQVSTQANLCQPGGCGTLIANFQWTDDGGTQVMNDGGGSIYTPLQLSLFNANGQGSCAYLYGVCVPMLIPPGANLPGGTFLVRANAGTPLIYSVTQTVGTPSNPPYDYFMTVEQLE
jgi:hypothetical protein